MPEATPFDPVAAGWAPIPDKGFVEMVGPIWTKKVEGRHRFGFQAEQRHANLVGVVQGGMIMTFADRGLGMIAWEAAGAPLVTLSYEHHFVGPGRIGSFIELDGEVVRATPGLVFMRGTVTSAGAPLASCSGIWKILSKRRQLDGPVFPA